MVDEDTGRHSCQPGVGRRKRLVSTASAFGVAQAAAFKISHRWPLALYQATLRLSREKGDLGLASGRNLGRRPSCGQHACIDGGIA